MTRDDINRMSREAGLGNVLSHNGGEERIWISGDDWHDEVERFAAIVASNEREACAKVVEQYTGAWSDQGYALAQAIRQRGKE